MTANCEDPSNWDSQWVLAFSRSVELFDKTKLFLRKLSNDNDSMNHGYLRWGVLQLMVADLLLFIIKVLWFPQMVDLCQPIKSVLCH